MDGIPRLRGVLHAWFFWVALAAGATLVAVAEGATARVAAGVYGAALCALFGASGLYHRWRFDPRWRPLLRRLDHGAIFVFIAASYTPVALLVLSGAVRVAVLVTVWAGADAAAWSAPATRWPERVPCCATGGRCAPGRSAARPAAPA